MKKGTKVTLAKDLTRTRDPGGKWVRDAVYKEYYVNTRTGNRVHEGEVSPQQDAESEQEEVIVADEEAKRVLSEYIEEIDLTDD